MIAALVLVVSLQGTQPPLAAVQPSPVVSLHITVLREWARAVRRHTPGEADAAARMVARLDAADLQHLWIDIRALVTVVKNPNVGTFLIRPDQPRGRIATIYPTEDDRDALLRLAADIESGSGRDGFYKRAAVLHSDVVMVLRDEPGTGRSEMSSLAPSRTFVQARDGQQIGVENGDIHWELGRMLLDEVRAPSSDDTVRAWYRATMSHKLARGELDTQHFDRGRRLFPGDAEVQFLFGALHEALSNPRIQVARESIFMQTGVTLDVQPERGELGEAQRYYSRALQIEPGHLEARVRHGRVLARVGRHLDAIDELRRALDASRDNLMTYYAHMFAGASEEVLGRYAVARVAYEQAAALYPRAQAPVIAASQLLHRTGDRQAAHAGLGAVLRPAGSKSAADDPWWDYHSGAGRFASERVTELYRSLSAGS